MWGNAPGGMIVEAIPARSHLRADARVAVLIAPCRLSVVRVCIAFLGRDQQLNQWNTKLEDPDSDTSEVSAPLLDVDGDIVINVKESCRIHR